jgi:hypothetical protein
MSILQPDLFPILNTKTPLQAMRESSLWRSTNRLLQRCWLECLGEYATYILFSSLPVISHRPHAVDFRSRRIVAPNALSEKALNEMSVDVRICRECRAVVFNKRDFALDLANSPQDARTYQTLVQFEQGIKNMMPRFQKLLSSLQ